MEFLKMLGWRRRRKRAGGRPKISVVVVVHNIPREAPRTLRSLSATYQRYIRAADYEVIVVDNGSTPPFDAKLLDRLKGNFRLIRIDPASHSPVPAVNRGLAEARGKVIGVMIDGARIATPGLLHFALHGAALHKNAVVTTLGWYLGHDFQRWAIRTGYDQAREDALLAAIDWPHDGYHLFEIGMLDESSVEGWFHPVAESNALFLRRGMWKRLGGMDERFASPGGGFVNADTYARAMHLPGARPVILLGEATFHQVHGGIATNAPKEESDARHAAWAAEYRAIRGGNFSFGASRWPPTYIGTLPRPMLSRFLRAGLSPLRGHNARTVGAGFDMALWGHPAAVRSTNPAIPGLVDLAQTEFRSGRVPGAVAVARLIREFEPDEPEAGRLLSLGPHDFDLSIPPGADFHLALGDGWRLLGDAERSAGHYRTALGFAGDDARARFGLSVLRMPGELYYRWLERLYRLPHVESILEIGVAQGLSLTCARPGTVAIGVDPQLDLASSFTAEVHLFPETSDAFFASRRLDGLLGGRPLGVGFIDGDHIFEQVLRDFINLEACCDGRSIILVHDTVPLDELTQRRERAATFYTGDVWKFVPCLRHYRPDLDVFTIATPYTGLTVIVGLDPKSRILAERYEEAVASYIDRPYSEIEGKMAEELAIVPNSWEVVAARLKARGIPVGEDGASGPAA